MTASATTPPNPATTASPIFSRSSISVVLNAACFGSFGQPSSHSSPPPAAAATSTAISSQPRIDIQTGTWASRLVRRR
ncbi:hypothetical protein [Lentzea sp. NPDC004782]|uniref:hypothetical protein n=1 Tax=Lentzea sp. NPDC004782 TaxID=3154458 RepID=UPI0033BCD122